MHSKILPILAATAIAVSLAPAAAVSAPRAAATWDNLVKVDSRKLDAVYLLPGADFRGYRKIMIDPASVAFRRGWQKDYNSSAVSPSNRISDAEAQEIARTARTGFDAIIRSAFTEGGYVLTDQPDPEVLRVSPAVFDLAITAPETPTAGRSMTWSVDVGEAAVLVEVRDSATGAVMGRVVDRKRLEDAYARRRTSVSNKADFEALFRRWASTFVAGLEHLKELSPINARGRSDRG